MTYYLLGAMVSFIPRKLNMWKKHLFMVLLIALSFAIGVLDFLTGPFFQFSYFFIIPVGFASWYNGRLYGLMLAMVLPALQCLYFWNSWESTFGTIDISLNLLMQCLIFSAFTELIYRVAQNRSFRIQMLECLPVGMWVVDRNGRLMQTNLEGRGIWGGNPKAGPGEGNGPKLWQHGSGIPIEPGERPVMRALLRGESSKNEVLDMETPDGAKVVILSSAAPVRDVGGKIMGAVVINQDITEAKRLEKEREELIISLEDARKNIKILSGLLPICANCKKIRENNGTWEQMESYIHTHSEAEFSHGICPDCMHKLYPEYVIDGGLQEKSEVE